jgi:hypothetical protein
VLLFLHSNYCKNEFSSYAEVSSLSVLFYVNSTNTETEVLCHTPTCDDATDFSCNCISSHSLDIQNCYIVGYWVFYRQTAVVGLQQILMCLGNELLLSGATLVCYPKNQDLQENRSMLVLFKLTLWYIKENQYLNYYISHLIRHFFSPRKSPQKSPCIWTPETQIT